jgi:hypothetical protein
LGDGRLESYGLGAGKFGGDKFGDDELDVGRGHHMIQVIVMNRVLF